MKKCKECERNEIRYSKRELCSTCYNTWLRNTNPKYKESENTKARIRKRIKDGNDPNGPLLRGVNGQGWIAPDGYKRYSNKVHPNRSKHGQILEHILVMSNYLGRPLRKDEVVHHINGIRHDNRIENLELWHRGQPPGQRVQDKIKYFTEFLESYGYSVKKIDDLH